MTTPDIAGLCERLRAITTTDHERLCQGREYTCSCGWDEENEAIATQAAGTLERQAAEIERLRALVKEKHDEHQFRYGDEEIPWMIAARAALTGEETATLSLSDKTQTDTCTRGDG